MHNGMEVTHESIIDSQMENVQKNKHKNENEKEKKKREKNMHEAEIV